MAEFEEKSATTYIHPPRKNRWGWLRIPGIVIGAVLAAELLFLAWVWPDWSEMKAGKIPASTLIEDYKDAREDDPKLPPLKWTPFTKQVPRSVSKVFVFAEDSRFYEHGGIDYQAIREAAEYNWKHKKFLLGASTISQQTTKNLFLSLSRNPLRKWHEFLLTYLLEFKLTKNEILHAYLNVAEFGRGIYGLEAAARTYFGTSASGLSQEQAIQLAATLPSPKKNNPKTHTRSFSKRTQRIGAAMRMVDQFASQGSSNSAEAQKALLDMRLQQMREQAEAERVQVEVEEAGKNTGTADSGLSGEELDASASSGTQTAPAPQGESASPISPASDTSGAVEAVPANAAPVPGEAPKEDNPSEASPAPEAQAPGTPEAPAP